MPFDLEFEGRVVQLRFHGEVSAVELSNAMEAIAAHPSFDDQRVLLVDWSAATLPALNDSVLHALAPAIGAAITNPWIDIVVVPDSEQTRALAQFGRPIFAHLRSLSFFPDREAAWDWIHAQTITLRAPRPR